jgi:hypothetical protein
MPQAQPPQTFGRYLLLKRIAKGGMAEIHRAVAFGEQGFAKPVAIKRMLPALSRESKFVDMFIDEAKLAAGLHHANIVELHDFGCIDNRLFHVMEYVQGLNVSQIINGLKQLGQPVPVALACFIVIEALYGLDHAHRNRDPQGRPQHIIHRDISPSNILVSFDGAVKLADFGIAKVTWSRQRTRTGVIKGKFKYMSPEQARGRDLDQRSDLFSLGVCLYKMLTLRDAYEGKTEQTQLLQARQAEFIPPRRINPAVAEPLEAIVLRAMQREREQRYPTAAALRDALEGWVFESGIKLFSSDLARFLADAFGDRIRVAQAELAREARRIDRAQPRPQSVDRMRAVDFEDMSTLVLDPRAADAAAAAGAAEADAPDSHTAAATVPSLKRPPPYALPRVEVDVDVTSERPAAGEAAAAPAAADWDDETELAAPAPRPPATAADPAAAAERTRVDSARGAAGRPLEQRRTQPLPVVDEDEGDDPSDDDADGEKG